MSKFFYHKEHDVIYGWNEITAELVKDGHVTDLIVVEADDPRVLRLLPKKSGEVQPEQRRTVKKPKQETVELPESVLDDAKE